MGQKDGHQTDPDPLGNRSAVLGRKRLGTMWAATDGNGRPALSADARNDELDTESGQGEGRSIG